MIRFSKILALALDLWYKAAFRGQNLRIFLVSKLIYPERRTLK